MVYDERPTWEEIRNNIMSVNEFSYKEPCINSENFKKTVQASLEQL